MIVKYLVIKIKILSKIIWLWDVFFTLVDNCQLKGYILLKSRLSVETVRLSDLQKYDNINVEEFDTWEDIK